MSGTVGYFAGLLTVPVAVLLVLAFLSAMQTGREIECRACGYSTGPMCETTRIAVWLRWHWHKVTTRHHTRRWLREQDRIAEEAL